MEGPDKASCSDRFSEQWLKYFHGVYESLGSCLGFSALLTREENKKFVTTWRVQGQIPTPDSSLENYSTFSFLEAGQLQPLLLHILQMYSLLVVGSARNS